MRREAAWVLSGLLGVVAVLGAAPAAAQDSDASRLGCVTTRLAAYPLTQVVANRALPLDSPLVFFPTPGEPFPSLTASYDGSDPAYDDKARKALARGLASFPPEERDVLLLAAVSRWLDNDNGFLNFFVLDSGPQYEAVVAALKRDGLDDYAALFQRGRALFGPNYGTEASRYARYSDGKGDIRDAPLEAALQEISDQYRNMPDLLDRAAARIEADAKLRAAYRERSAAVEDAARLDYLTGGLRHCLSPYGDSARAQRLLAQLPPIYARILSIDLLDAETRNGSVDQFFYNSSGDFAPLALKSLQDLGLQKEAEALTKAMGRFPSPYIEDRERRTTLMIAQGERHHALMDEVTGVLDKADLPASLIKAARAAGVLPR